METYASYSVHEPPAKRYTKTEPMAQPVEPLTWGKTMKTFNIEIKINVALVLVALSELIFTIAFINAYL